MTSPEPEPTGPTGPTGPVADAPLATLRGTKLSGATGLRFVIPSQPGAVIFDADRGTSVGIAGLPPGRWVDRLLKIGDTVVLSTSCENCRPAVHVLPPGSTIARKIADGTAVATTLDGRGLWLRTDRAGRCALGRIGLDGLARSKTLPLSCAVYPVAETRVGLVAPGPEQDSSLPSSVVLRTSDLRPVFRGPWVLAALGHRILTQGPAGYSDKLVLTDLRTKTVRRIAPPTSPGTISEGHLSPDGRWVAVEFGNPAWPGPRQILDLWLLDTRTFRWHRLPSMPVPLSLKETGLSWTDDGRLALLGRFDRDPDVSIDRTFDALVLWRPSDPELRVRTSYLPRTGGTGALIR